MRRSHVIKSLKEVFKDGLRSLHLCKRFQRPWALAAPATSDDLAGAKVDLLADRTNPLGSRSGS